MKLQHVKITLIVLSLIFIASCVEEDGPIDPDGSDDSYYVKFIFDGAPEATWKDGDSGGNVKAAWGAHGTGIERYDYHLVQVMGILEYESSTSTKTVQKIQVNFMKFFTSYIYDSDIIDMFKSNNTSYANESTDQDGIKVSYQDKNGTVWSTDNEPGSQAGSSFSILSMKEAPTGSSIDYLLIGKVSFSCNLYDPQGNMKAMAGTIRCPCGSKSF
jgi:hypothetical protein